MNTNADTSSPASLLTNACAAPALSNGPVNNRLVARSGVVQAVRDFNIAGAFAAIALHAFGRSLTFAPPATCTQCRDGSAGGFGAGFAAGFSAGFFTSGFLVSGLTVSGLAASRFGAGTTGFGVGASARADATLAATAVGAGADGIGGTPSSLAGTAILATIAANMFDSAPVPRGRSAGRDALAAAGAAAAGGGTARAVDSGKRDEALTNGAGEAAAIAGRWVSGATGTGRRAAALVTGDEAAGTGVASVD